MNNKIIKKSKNEVTIDHLKLSCRHIREMINEGITENHSIRILELLTDVYAKLHMGGTASPHHVSQVKLWSKAARKIKKLNPKAKPQDYFRVEHGTPRREFSRMVLQLYIENKLNKKIMNHLVKKYWKLAVITLEEDKKLNKIARSKMFDTPEKRWANADIKF